MKPKPSIRELKENIKALQYAIGILIWDGYAKEHPVIQGISIVINDKIKQIEEQKNEMQKQDM